VVWRNSAGVKEGTPSPPPHVSRPERPAGDPPVGLVVVLVPVDALHGEARA
jgi:hypothetical protein